MNAAEFRKATEQARLEHDQRVKMHQKLAEKYAFEEFNYAVHSAILNKEWQVRVLSHGRYETLALQKYADSLGYAFVEETVMGMCVFE